MLTIELSNSELEHLLSLNESEAASFFEDLDRENIDSVIEQMRLYSPGSPESSNYAGARSQRAAEIINAKTAIAQEIGPLPEIVNPERREAAARNNLLFAETYFGPTFYLPWAPYQRSMMDRFQSIVLSGGRECHAVRRGGLKSTCARVSTLWAVVNGHRRFPVLVGATDDKANEHRENFFSLLSSSTLLLEDYPELKPLLLKWYQPKRQFRLDGRLLKLHPKDARGRIVFPDIHDSVSCQSHIAPYSINATGVSGLSFVDRFGVTIRPDLLVFDDVQTPQSAKSPLMTEEREEAITKTFCGLAGLGEKLAAIMVATVQEHDDLTERFLSRSKHPDWNGEKYPSIIRMPERADLWEIYSGKLGMGETPEQGKRDAQEYYRRHRQEMDLGGIAAWEHDKLPDELSALQSLMTVKAIDPSFFQCEIQQEGEVAVNTSGLRLDSQALLTRTSGIERGIVPNNTDFLVAYVDSSDKVLWWMVLAVSKDLSGAVVDYGTWPDQGRPVFYKSDLVNAIGKDTPDLSWEESFVRAHNSLDEFLCRSWFSENGKERQVDVILKDWSDGGQMPLIRSQIASSKHRNRIRAAKGFAPKPNRKQIHLWGDKHRDRSGSGWIERRTETPIHVQYDANIIKSVAARRLLTTQGAPSAIMLPGLTERTNRLLVEHLTSERPQEIMYDGARGIAWTLIPSRDNDWWDCFCGCITAASVLGCKLSGEVSTRREVKSFILPGGVRRG